MDFSTMLNSLQTTLGQNLPRIAGALAILVVGWFVAIAIRAVVRRGLGAIGLNSKLETGAGLKMDVEGGTARGAYYLVLLIVLIAFFNMLQLQMASQPLQSLVDTVMEYVPKVVAAGLLALIAFVLATLLRRLATKALSATSLDEKLAREAGMRPISETLGMVLYAVVLLLFLPAVVGALGIEGLLQPTRDMIDAMVGMLPNVFGAVIIGLVGWFVARLLRDLVTNLASVAGADKLGTLVGLRGTASLSRLLGMIVFIFVLVPTAIQALDTLKIEAISGPATEMLTVFWAAVPNIFAAALILVLAYAVARFLVDLVVPILNETGFNALPERMGLSGVFTDKLTLAGLVGKLIVFFAVMFAVVEAANRLAFTRLAELASDFTEFAGQVLLGIAVIGLGLWLSNVAYGALRGMSGPRAMFTATLVRYAIIGLVFAMGLHAMGIADHIVNLAFGLTLGSIAVAVALSFGLGGREAAGRQMEHWLKGLRSGEDSGRQPE